MNKLYNKPITLELVEKVFEKSKEDRKWVFYTSELGKIELNWLVFVCKNCFSCLN